MLQKEKNFKALQKKKIDIKLFFPPSGSNGSVYSCKIEEKTKTGKEIGERWENSQDGSEQTPQQSPSTRGPSLPTLATES